ncbi:hypothetical protein [Paenibacillus sp. GM2]|uniref:hypothetical protein n=1 Tax=Paenibacillus sp. GM2 TaxID=1622070 RepID=UPI000839CA0D|nr:hypothetical protein [Paenibacillus sp. GM2]
MELADFRSAWESEAYRFRNGFSMNLFYCLPAAEGVTGSKRDGIAKMLANLPAFFVYVRRILCDSYFFPGGMGSYQFSRKIKNPVSTIYWRHRILLKIRFHLPLYRLEIFV